MNKIIFAAAAVFALAFPLAAQGDTPTPAPNQPAFAAGGAVTVGSHDYSGVRFFGDVAWKAKDLGPYARADMTFDSFQRAVTVGGGVWKSLESGVDVKGGLGLTSARFKDTDESGSSVTLEVAAEKAYGEPVLGAEYRLTSGSVGTTPSGRAGGGRFSRPTRFGRDSKPESFSSHELSGYGRIPAGPASLGLRLTVYDPSDSDTVLSETFSASVPLTPELAATAALSFEQSDGDDGTYLTLGGRYRF